MERKCLGCETVDESVFMFEGRFYDNELNEWVSEVYCNECLANILTEEPEIVSEVAQI